VGVFFDPEPPSDADVEALARLYRQAPPPDEDALNAEVGRHVGLLASTGISGSAVIAALRNDDELNEDNARTRAQAALSRRAPMHFNTLRFTIALLIFLALVGGGVAADAAHLTASSSALFGFAGAVFGVVTAFLGAGK
jgi:hypothetical protein